MSTKQVTRVDRSPMNAKRWCLELECGHEVWVTATRRPKARTAICKLCPRPAAQIPDLMAAPKASLDRKDRP